jgi:hypothetical protein
MIRGVEITETILDDVREFHWQCECGEHEKEPLRASWEAIAEWKHHLSTPLSVRTRGYRSHELATLRA